MALEGTDAPVEMAPISQLPSPSISIAQIFLANSHFSKKISSIFLCKNGSSPRDFFFPFLSVLYFPLFWLTLCIF